MIEVITIDGPAASGKSSVSRELARHLNWSWVSTGSFYRGLAYVAKEKNLSFTDEAALAALAVSDEWEVRMETERTAVYFNKRDVSAEAHSEAMGNFASKVSQFPKVRQALLQAQRNCATNVRGLIAEGRDCGSVVFPNADLKIYLTASSENRAQRRAKESGESADEILQQQVLRDARDKERKTAPLQIAPNSHIIDTGTLSLRQVVEVLANLYQSQSKA